MGRLVEPRPAGGRLTAGEGRSGVKDYLERVARYVPAETVAFYLTFSPIMVSATGDAEAGLREALLLVVLVAGFVFTPLYLRAMREEGKPWVLHAVVGTVAYLIWSYATGIGWWVQVDIYHAAVAALILGIFTLGSGLVAPSEGSR